MSRASLTLAVVFLSFLALSRAADLPENDVTAESNPTILLPSDAAATVVAEAEQQPDNEIKPIEADETATTVTFRPADHMLDGSPKFSDSLRFPFRVHRRPCRHGTRRPSNPSDLQAKEISYGNDMVTETVEVNADGSISETGNQDLTLWGFRHHLPRRHQHDKPDAEKEDREEDSDSDSDDEFDHGMKRFHHGRHHFDRKDTEVENKHDRRPHEKPDGEEKGQPWKMMRVSHDHEEFDHGMKGFRHGHHKRDDEEHDHRPHHHHRRHEEDGNEEHHHHIHHHHHHHGENEDEEKGGFLSSFRKFLTNPF